jgi:hypothetical protein
MEVGLGRIRTTPLTATTEVRDCFESCVTQQRKTASWISARSCSISGSKLLVFYNSGLADESRVKSGNQQLVGLY